MGATDVSAMAAKVSDNVREREGGIGEARRRSEELRPGDVRAHGERCGGASTATSYAEDHEH